MGIQPATFLLLLVIYLLVQTTMVSGACCTRGQPLYTGDSIYVSSTYGFPLSFLTCSDGPCSGPSFDYRAIAFESADPSQCCDSQNLGETGTQQGNAGSYYNPQKNSASYWLGSAGASYNNGSPIPGTGLLACNSDLPVVTCGIKGVLLETCQSLRVANTFCGLNTVYNDNNNAKTTTNAGFQATCCRPATCADFKNSKLCAFPLTTYNDAADSTTTTVLSYQTDCCKKRTCDQMKSDVQCNAGTKYAQGNAALFVIDFQQQCCQPSTCADVSGSCLTGYIAKPLTTILGPLADYSTDCCTPILPSCGNTVPTLTPGVKYDCSLLSLLGIWKYDDTKEDQAPSQDNCCKQSTCGSLLVDDKLSCDAGFKYCGDDALKPNIFKTDCCVPNTCADVAGSCGTGYTAKPLTTILGALSVDFTKDCCTPIGATCGNTLPLLLLPIPYDCSKISPGVWTYDSTKSGLTPTDVNCCKTKKCGEMVSSGSTCTTGSTYTSASTQDVTTSFQQDCCQAVAPTCSNTVPATPGVKYDCSAQTPGAWVYDSVKDTSSPPDCCKRLSCTAAVTASPSTYTCPTTYTYVGTDAILFTNFTADCCQKPTSAACSTLKSQNSTCGVNRIYDSSKNSTLSTSSSYDTDCCKAATCADAKNAGAICATNTSYMSSNNLIKIANSYATDCCTSKCKFSSSGGKCPVFSWADVSSSFRLTAGSVQGKVNIKFTNGFVYNYNCGMSISWLTIATCGTCQKLSSASIGTSFNEMKDVDCGSTIYVIGYDGTYKSNYSNCLAPFQLSLDVCINLNLLGGISLLSSACYSNDYSSGACKWPLTVQCPSALQINAGINISI